MTDTFRTPFAAAFIPEVPDASSGGFTPNAFAAQVAVQRHSGGANYLFADAHVEKLSWLKVKALLGPPVTRFVRPDGQN